MSQLFFTATTKTSLFRGWSLFLEGSLAGHPFRLHGSCTESFEFFFLKGFTITGFHVGAALSQK